MASLWVLMVLYMRQSSANNLISEFTDSGRSFIKKEETKGDQAQFLAERQNRRGVDRIVCYLLLPALFCLLEMTKSSSECYFVSHKNVI